MASHAAAGQKALNDTKYDEAIRLFTLALKESPTSPDYLIKRSTAHQRAQKHDLALADANNAVLNAQKRAKKELITEAQFRRGVALYGLKRYGDADFLFKLVKQRDDKHKMVATWLAKMSKDLGKEDLSEEQRGVRVKETPSEEEASGQAGGESKDVEMGGTNGANASAANGSSSTAPAAPPAQPTQTPADKIRQDWYQNTTNVYFTLLARGVPAEKTTIEITPTSLSISFPLQTGSSYDLTLDPLFTEVKPEECIKRVLPTKVEVVLVKAEPGRKWSSLESTAPATTAPTTSNGADDAVKSAILSSATEKAPSYPTSSKSGPKNWDAVTKEASAALRDPNAKAGSAEDDDDYEGGDEANHFFKKLFKGASPEVQKAMMKSYTESNGTALSTNWEEVSKGVVKTEPPDGMVAREWGK